MLKRCLSRIAGAGFEQNVHHANKKFPIPNILKTPLTIVRGIFAVRKGLEPSTSGVTGRHSNQLNYRTSIGCFLNADAKLSIFSESAIA